MILPETVIHDLKYGARMLVRNAGLTIVTVLALAIGIGVNTAVFTAYKALITRPLDASAPNEMVNLALIRDSGVIDYTFSYPDYEAYRDSVRSLSGLVAFRLTRATLSNSAGAINPRNAEFAGVFMVSENYFKVLGVAALHGRTFESIGTSELVANPSVLISENYWQRRFAGDPAILGKTIYLNGVAVTVVGITPRDFVGTGVATSAFWVPVSLEPLIQSDDEWLRKREDQRYRLVGRLASGATRGQAQAEMSTIADRLRTLHDPSSESAKPVTALVWPGSPTPLPMSQYAGPIFFVHLIMLAAGIVLAVACANVGSLQLARARSRQHELNTRLSLGASRLRLIRQLLTESALMGLIAGALALLFTWAFLKALVMLSAKVVPVESGTFVADVTPDLVVFSYVFAISVVAGLVSGFVPAMESSRSALSSVVRAGTSSVRTRRLQDILVATQVAFSVVLLIAGAVAIRSSIKSLAIDPGYESNNVVELDLRFPEASKYTAEHKLALVRELRVRLTELPGVVAVTTGRVPGQTFRTPATPLDAETTSSKSAQSLIHYAYVQSNYFQTLGIPLILGSPFQLQMDQRNSAIVSESTARQLWNGQNPMGRSLRLGPTDERFHNQRGLLATGTAYQVVGVVRDTRGMESDGSDSKSVYLLLPDDRLQEYPILIRTRSDAAQLLKAIDEVTISVDPNLMAPSSTLKELLRQSPTFITSSLAAAIASAVGLLGLLLALMGIYGTVSHIVILRTREVGIRMALGAQKRNVLELILRESTRPVIAGLIAGIILATGASYLARGLLYGLNGVDGVSFAIVSFLFLIIAFLASYPPARRAMRIDPMVALRYD